jgi:ribonuclease-3
MSHKALTDEERFAAAEAILGYRFKDRDLLARALTHASAAPGEDSPHSYERLEFLGDAILGMVVSKAIYLRFPNMNEGGMTRIKVSLVSGQRLSSIMDELGFANLIAFGSSETGTGNRGLTSALEDVFESLVAAMMLDGGLEVAERWLDATLMPLISEDLADEPTNPKSTLQELLQVDKVTPTYRVTRTEGPPHRRVFTVDVLAGKEIIGHGSGHTKKDAEAAAARMALEGIGQTP